MTDILPQISLVARRSDMYDLASGSCEPQQFFDQPYSEFHLEIGFGGGEHLAWQAGWHRHTGFLGVEFYTHGVASFLMHHQHNNLSNCRIYHGDGREVVRILKAAVLDRIYILFPDPWRKKRHYQRRIIQHDFLNEIAHCLKPGGELRIGTDDPSYQTWVMAHLYDHPYLQWCAQSAADWKIRPDDWPQSRYEQKAIEKGHLPVYLRFHKK